MTVEALGKGWESDTAPRQNQILTPDSVHLEFCQKVAVEEGIGKPRKIFSCANFNG